MMRANIRVIPVAGRRRRTRIRRSAAAAGFLLLGCGCPLAASIGQAPPQEHELRPGLYEIEVVTSAASGGASATRVVTRCVTEQARLQHSAFAILTDTPAAACPKYEICTGGPRVGLQTLCAGPVAASAVGMFALDEGGFRGRIDIDRERPYKALIELQYGRRVGDCPSR